MRMQLAEARAHASVEASGGRLGAPSSAARARVEAGTTNTNEDQCHVEEDDGVSLPEGEDDTCPIDIFARVGNSTKEEEQPEELFVIK